MEASYVAAPLMALDLSEAWNGTATALLRTLESMVEETTTKRKQWPADPRALSAGLRRLAPNLRSKGIVVEFDTPRRRYVLIRKAGDSSDISVPATSASLAGSDLSTGLVASAADGMGPMGSHSQGRVVGREQPRTRPQGLSDVADVANVAKSPTHSGDDQPVEDEDVAETNGTEADDDVGEV